MMYPKLCAIRWELYWRSVWGGGQFEPTLNTHLMLHQAIPGRPGYSLALSKLFNSAHYVLITETYGFKLLPLCNAVIAILNLIT
jgi:hypothetical protein